MRRTLKSQRKISCILHFNDLEIRDLNVWGSQQVMQVINDSPFCPLGGAEGTIRHLLTKNPLCFFSYLLSQLNYVYIIILSHYIQQLTIGLHDQTKNISLTEFRILEHLNRSEKVSQSIKNSKLIKSSKRKHVGYK